MSSARTQKIVAILDRMDYRSQTPQRLAEAILEVAPDRKRSPATDLPRWHHSNPWRCAQRTKSLAAIRQRHSGAQSFAPRATWPAHSVHHYPPTVVVTDKYQGFSFDAPRLVWAIINAVGERDFKSIRDEEDEYALRHYANELIATWFTADVEAGEELLAVIGESDVKLGQNLNKMWLEGAEFWGYHLEKFPKPEKNRVVWRFRKG